MKAAMKPVIDYYDNLANDYDRDRFANSYGRYIDALERSILSQWLRDTAPATTADFGCGTGRLLDYAHTGLDGSAGMLQVAAEKFPDRRLIHTDLTHLPLADGEMEHGICFHVAMHLDQPTLLAFLQEAARVIRPGGSLIFDIPSAPRRALSRRPRSGWHGDTDASIAQIKQWAEPQWSVRRWRGILLFPIHRIPAPLRPLFRGLDAGIGCTALARYASYYVIELQRLA